MNGGGHNAYLSVTGNASAIEVSSSPSPQSTYSQQSSPARSESRTSPSVHKSSTSQNNKNSSSYPPMNMPSHNDLTATSGLNRLSGDFSMGNNSDLNSNNFLPWHATSSQPSPSSLSAALQMNSLPLGLMNYDLHQSLCSSTNNQNGLLAPSATANRGYSNNTNNCLTQQQHRLKNEPYSPIQLLRNNDNNNNNTTTTSPKSSAIGVGGGGGGQRLNDYSAEPNMKHPRFDLSSWSNAT